MGPYSPSPIATATPDLTANWKTYTNTKYGFSFKFPESINKLDKITDDLVDIYGMDNLVIQINVIKTNETDPLKWWNNQTIEPYTKKSVTCFTKNTSSTVKSLYDSNKTILDLKENVLMLDNWRSKENACSEPPEVMILLIPHNGKIINITSDWGLESEQILSTFKFTQ